jgi:hypothetical protein
MTVQMQGGVVVIGCGDFGAAAVNHLKERGAELASGGGRRGVALVALTGKAATRQQAESIFQSATQGGWRELEEALRLFNSPPLIALIGAADDAAGGGLVVSALRYLTENRQGRRAVWLALPTGGSRAQAKAYATLLELELLRKNAAMTRCFLREDKGDPLEFAGMFGEAAVAYAQGDQGVGMYAGFGLGAVRDVAGLMTQQAAVLAAKAIVQQRAASRGYQPAGFAGALMRTADELLRAEPPEAWYKERWMTETSSFVSYCLSDDYAGERLAAFLDRHLKDQYHYYYGPHSQWGPGVSRRSRPIRERLTTQIRDFRETCGTDSEAACQELSQALAGLGEAMRSAASMYDQSYRRSVRECESLRLQVSELIFWLNGGAVLTRRPTVDQRQKLVQAFEEMDRKIASGIIDRVRFQELQAAVLDLEKERTSLAATVATAGKRQETFAKLRDEVAAWTDEAVPVTQGIHLFPSVAGAESARRLAEVIEGASLVTAMNHGSAQSPSARAAALKNAALIQARAALDRMPELLPPRGEAARERWLTAVKPSLALANPLPQGHKPPARTYRISDNVPADIKAELVQQLDGVPASSSIKWFQGDGLVYCETNGVELACLNALPELHGAYSTQLGQQQGLHVLPEPADGWSSLLPEARVPRKQLEAAAATVVRACLLGLIGPAAESMLTARYLQEDRQAIQSVSWLNLGEAVRSLAQHKPLLDGLTAQAQRWFSRLDESQVAGYYALLNGFQQSPAVTRLKGDEAAVVAKAIAAEMEEAVRTLRDRGDGWGPRARAMAEQVGGSEDSFSLAAGEWRYLKW